LLEERFRLKLHLVPKEMLSLLTTFGPLCSSDLAHLR
jgi:hypothetical protein